jgi:pyruvate,water dikinase
MAVVVMLMIPAQASGVLYTCNPNDPEQKAMMISAVRGLGAKAVGGQMPSSLFLVEKTPVAAVLRQEIISQETMSVCLPGGGVAEVPLPAEVRENPLLSTAQLRALAALGLRLEEHYGRPVDIEWALGPDGDLYLLQARGLRIITKGIQPADYDRLVAEHAVLIKDGITASHGVAAGPVVQVQTSSDLAKVTPGCVLVAQSSLPEYAMFLDQAAALVTEVGGVASHLASVARERRVPAIFGATGARQALAEGQPVTVDAERGVIYQGRIQALVILQKKRFLALAETQAYQNLERVLQRIIPLNLTDPRMPEFTPLGCRSLHDITRYCHEMAMQEMFRYGEACLSQTGGDACVTQGAARRLIADFPLELFLIDLGGGIRLGTGATQVREGDIISQPMLGLLKGIHSVEWRGPGAVEARTLAK